MDNEMHKRIVKFIKKHHVFTLATQKDSQPWCAQCFYAYDPEIQALIFLSDKNTRHIDELVQNNKVAASIVLETKIVYKIRGLQIEGAVYLPEGKALRKAKKTYLLRFPFAVLKQTHLWILELNTIKMTDNRLGFGKKLRWSRG